MAHPTGPATTTPSATPDLAAALGKTRAAVAARDELIERMRASSVPAVEFNAVQDRLANAAPGLLAAVEAVLARHRADGDDVPSFCLSCGDGWPCPTVRAVARALEAGQ